MSSPFTAPMGRDYRIDFFRGLALISIFINHMPGNLFANFTTRNFGLSDSAEVFVLLAGISAALAYFPRFMTGRAGLATGLVVRRVGLLYVAHVAAVGAGFAIYGLATLWLQKPELMQPDERHWVLDQPLRALIGIGAMTYQTGNFNILPMYVVMMLMLPAIMLLARWRFYAPLAASAALWLVANIFRLNIPAFPGIGGWYFNPLTWQLIFAFGFTGGVMLRTGRSVPRSWSVYWLCVAYLVVCFALAWGNLWHFFPHGTPRWLWLSGFDKSWVGLFRLAHLLALAYVVLQTSLPGYLSQVLTHANPIVSIGRNTLPVFWLSTLLSVTGHIVREDVFLLSNDPTFTPFGMALDCLLVGSGLVIMLALARFLDWTSPASKARAVPAALLLEVERDKEIASVA